MATTESSASAHQPTDIEGRKLYRERGDEFRHEHGAWLVPSRTDEDQVYEVCLGPVESCECSERTYAGDACPHIAAASMAQAKSSVCSCCGRRVLGRFLSQVTEDDELLSWFVGNVLCADCIRDGYWV